MLKPSRCASRTRAYWSTVTILHLLAAGSVYQHTGGSCGGTVFNEDFCLGGGPGLDEDYHVATQSGSGPIFDRSNPAEMLRVWCDYFRRFGNKRHSGRLALANFRRMGIRLRRWIANHLALGRLLPGILSRGSGRRSDSLSTQCLRIELSRALGGTGGGARDSPEYGWRGC